MITLTMDNPMSDPKAELTM
jgi:hypothetical protein